LQPTANGQSNVPFRFLLLTKAAPDYRHCGLVAPAHFSKGLGTRKKRLKHDEASMAVGGARGGTEGRRESDVQADAPAWLVAS
jgi:hypothetical protein